MRLRKLWLRVPSDVLLALRWLCGWIGFQDDEQTASLSDCTFWRQEGPSRLSESINSLPCWPYLSYIIMGMKSSFLPVGCHVDISAHKVQQ